MRPQCGRIRAMMSKRSFKLNYYKNMLCHISELYVEDEYVWNMLGLMRSKKAVKPRPQGSDREEGECHLI